MANHEVISEDPNNNAVVVFALETSAVVGTYLGSKAITYEVIENIALAPVKEIEDACEAPPTTSAEGQTPSIPNCSETMIGVVDQKVYQGENTADTVSDTLALGPTVLVLTALVLGHRANKRARKASS